MIAMVNQRDTSLMIQRNHWSSRLYGLFDSLLGISISYLITNLLLGGGLLLSTKFKPPMFEVEIKQLDEIFSFSNFFNVKQCYDRQMFSMKMTQNIETLTGSSRALWLSQYHDKPPVILSVLCIWWWPVHPSKPENPINPRPSRKRKSGQLLCTCKPSVMPQL